MDRHGVQTSVLRAVDHDIATGVWPDLTEHGWAGDEWPARVRAAHIACHDEGIVAGCGPNVRAVLDDAGRRVQRPGDDGLLIEPDGAARRIIGRGDEIPGRRAQRPARAQAGHASVAVAKPQREIARRRDCTRKAIVS